MKLFVVDALGLIFRAYHALPPMSGPKGEETHALFGFIKQMEKLLRETKPDYIAAVFDGPDNKAWRTELCPEYKSNREKAPQSLVRQMIWSQEYCELMGISTLTVAGVEADDTIGSIATWTESEGIELVICAQDKDLCQLVSDKTTILHPHKAGFFYTKQSVQDKFGVGSDQIIDYLSLVGDSSDNIPGLRGVGPKTAAAWLGEWGSLSAILENKEAVGGGKKTALLEESAERLRLNQKLVSLRTDVDFPKEAVFFRKEEPQIPKLAAFYKRLGLRSLTESLAQLEKLEATYHCIKTEEELKALTQKLTASALVAFDTETTGLDPMQSDIVGIGFAISRSEAWYVPFNGPLTSETLKKHLSPLFEKGNFFAHNLKFDLLVLWQAGFFPKSCTFDTMIASYLLFAGERSHALNNLALDFFDVQMTPIEDLIGKGKSQISMADVPIDQASDYCGEDVVMTWMLKERLEPMLEERGLMRLLTEMELPLCTILAKMQQRGIFLDKEPLKKLEIKIKEDLATLSEEIFSLAGETFNINSPKQLSHILFEKLGIAPPKKTKTGYSTNSDVLEQLSAEWPIAQKLLDYRSLEKLRSTYVEALPTFIHPQTGRIHCTFNQTLVATGRLSCHNPNLQNIPVRSPLGGQIRAGFRPAKEGWSFLAADYSQIELRIVAHLSEEPALIEAFSKGEDIHAFTASLVYDVPLSEVTKEQRFHAKAVNFGLIYGQGAFGLSRQLRISQNEAKAFIAAYFDRYPKVKAFLERAKEEAKASGKARTLLGRERTIENLDSSNGQLRSAAERLAINTPIQGTDADIAKLAMVAMRKKLESMQTVMLLQIHDEILFEVPDNEVVESSRLIKETMESIIELKVPLVVNIKVGKNWQEC